MRCELFIEEVLFSLKEVGKFMASFVKLRMSELMVNSQGRLVCLEEDENVIHGLDLSDEFCFNMLTEVDGLGICFGFSPRFVNERLGW